MQIGRGRRRCLTGTFAVFPGARRHGSLSAAAKVLHVSQSTVGRRLTSLEATLAVRLLNRTPDGYVQTLAGAVVREKAELLETETLALEHDISGRDAKLRGLVRVTCADPSGPISWPPASPASTPRIPRS